MSVVVVIVVVVPFYEHEHKGRKQEESKSLSRYSMTLVKYHVISLVISLALLLAVGVASMQKSFSALLPALQQPTLPPKSFFEQAYDIAYRDVIKESQVSCGRNTTNPKNAKTDCFPRRRADLSNYNGTGGLRPPDRESIAELYYNVESVFEFGVGERSDIASATNLPRYVGVDSSADWVWYATERQAAFASTLPTLGL